MRPRPCDKGRPPNLIYPHRGEHPCIAARQRGCGAGTLHRSTVGPFWSGRRSRRVVGRTSPTKVEKRVHSSPKMYRAHEHVPALLILLEVLVEPSSEWHEWFQFLGMDEARWRRRRGQEGLEGIERKGTGRITAQPYFSITRRLCAVWQSTGLALMPSQVAPAASCTVKTITALPFMSLTLRRHRRQECTNVITLVILSPRAQIAVTAPMTAWLTLAHGMASRG